MADAVVLLLGVKLDAGRAGRNTRVYKVDDVGNVAGQTVLVGADVVLSRGAAAVDMVLCLEKLLQGCSVHIDVDGRLGRVDVDVLVVDTTLTEPLLDGVDGLVIRSKVLDDFSSSQVLAVIGRLGVGAALRDVC